MRDIASRLAGRGVSGDSIRGDTKDRDVTVAPQTQTCGRTTGVPRRRPEAIRTETLSILKPTEDNGSAWSQSPDPGEREARSRALSPGSDALFRSF